MIGLNCRFDHAGTSEMFGVTPLPQDEETPFHPRSPYGAPKLCRDWMTRNYREPHGILAVNDILFHHVSPRRGGTFLTREITHSVKFALEPVGLDWEGQVKFDDRQLRHTEVDSLIGGPSKAAYVLGSNPLLLLPVPARIVLDAGIASTELQ